MDFAFLFDPSRDLFSIGFNVTEGRRDASFYDLLASEARLCSYRHHRAGPGAAGSLVRARPFARRPRGEPVLVSWSGSMFEYLMPLLVMPNYDSTLLDQPAKRPSTSRSSMAGSAACRGVSPNPVTTPTECSTTINTGPSASPGLGLKRGLAEDLVIAPYATRAGADGRAAGGVPKTCNASPPKDARRLRLLRSGRLHAVAAAARTRRASPSDRSWRITRA